MINFSLYLRLLPIVKRYNGQPFINFHHAKYHIRYSAAFPSIVFEKIKSPFPMFLTYRYMAGHAKWQNIKHIKAEKDKQKSMLYNKYIRLVTGTVRERGPDPKSNVRLAQVIDEAKKNNVPSSTIENAIKRAMTKKIKAGTIEMLGPGGCIVVLEYESDNVGDMRRMIKIICRKYNAGIFPGDGGRWRAAYEQKGIIKVISQLNCETFDSEKMLDAAIEAGAEDVQKRNEEDTVFYEFYCSPDDINTVKKELEQKFSVEEAYVAYLPISTVSLSEADKTIALSFLNELAELPDVSRMYENIE